MNILLDKFPTKAEIDGKIYNLNTDYRNCLNIILAFEDRELNDYEKSEIMIELLYGKDNIPSNIELAIQKAILFLDCGEEKKASEGKSDSLRVYSFTKDAKYIYSAIKQTHGIDLDNIDYLHWWKFVYLFLDLNKECFFSQMIYLRSQKQKGKLTKEEKELYMKLIDTLELEQDNNYNEEEQNHVNKFMSLLQGGNDNNERL